MKSMDETKAYIEGQMIALKGRVSADDQYLAGLRSVLRYIDPPETTTVQAMQGTMARYDEGV